MSTIPEQPSQGAVAAALGVVLPSARACVAGADEASHALVTFSSDGHVTDVTVSGWAESHGATACIKQALYAAKVEPFSKPTFTVGVRVEDA